MEVRELVAGSLARGRADRAVSSQDRRGLDELRQRAASTLAAAMRARASRGRGRGCRSIGCSRCKGFGTVVTGTLWRDAFARTTSWCCCRGAAGEGSRPAGARGAARRGARRPACRRQSRRRGGRRRRARQHARARRQRSSPRASSMPSIELLAGARPLRHGARVRFHQGTAELLGRVALASTGGRRAIAR